MVGFKRRRTISLPFVTFKSLGAESIRTLERGSHLHPTVPQGLRRFPPEDRPEPDKQAILMQECLLCRGARTRVKIVKIY